MKKNLLISIALFAIASLTASAQLSPIAWYHCNEVSDTILADASGNGNDAYVTATTETSDLWVEGKVNGGIQLNGEHIVLPAIALDLYSDQGSVTFSMFCWNSDKISAIFSLAAKNADGVMTDGMGKEAFDMHVHMEQPGGPWLGGELCFRSQMTPDPDGTALHLIADPDQVLGEAPASGESKAVVIDSVWHHVAATWKNGDKMKLYLDGEFVVEGDYAPEIVAIDRVLFGSMGNDGRKYKGILDELRVYNDVIDATEVKDIFDEAWIIGVNEVTANQVGLKAYPIPAKSSLNVNFINRGAEATLSLVTIAGQTVQSTTTTNSSETLDISNLSQGVYLLKLELNGQASYTKVIVE